jgi:hypothetical protein
MLRVIHASSAIPQITTMANPSSRIFTCGLIHVIPREPPVE